MLVDDEDRIPLPATARLSQIIEWGSRSGKPRAVQPSPRSRHAARTFSSIVKCKLGL